MAIFSPLAEKKIETFQRSEFRVIISLASSSLGDRGNFVYLLVIRVNKNK